jgi:hypothetical protein
MKRTLSEWASIADIASGIAVIITLLVLVQSINANTEIARATAYDGYIDSLNFVRSQALNDPEFQRAWLILVNTPEKLDSADSFRLGLYMQMFFGIYEKAYYSNQYGLLGSSMWDRFRAQMCIQFPRARSIPLWSDRLETVISPEFLQYLQNTCATDQE